MATLFDKIRYDHKLHSDLNDPVGKKKIETLVVKLRPLETEIVNEKEGTITIMKSGNIFSDGFSLGLAEKITKIVSGVRHL